MGRVWPRHGYHGRPLNLVVKRQTMQLIADLLEFIATLVGKRCRNPFWRWV